jgi:hypothetical protein
MVSANDRDPKFSSDEAWHSDSVPCILFHKIFIGQALRILLCDSGVARREAWEGTCI